MPVCAFAVKGAEVGPIRPGLGSDKVHVGPLLGLDVGWGERKSTAA